MSIEIPEDVAIDARAALNAAAYPNEYGPLTAEGRAALARLDQAIYDALDEPTPTPSPAEKLTEDYERLRARLDRLKPKVEAIPAAEPLDAKTLSEAIMVARLFGCLEARGADVRAEREWFRAHDLPSPS